MSRIVTLLLGAPRHFALMGFGLAVLVALATATAAHGAKRGALELGVWDENVFLSGDGTTRAQWLDRAVDVGASKVTLQASWRDIAPRRPTDPSDPNDPAYDWSLLDAAVRDAAVRGLSVTMLLFEGPDWAEGPNPEPDPPGDPGSWRPSPSLFGQFAGAAGARYSGRFPDPRGSGQNLPQVRLWQIWGEPNYGRFLQPQWERSGGKLRMASPAHYREMVNAAYSALNGVDPANRVIAGGFLPVGDYKSGGGRIEPLRFLREFFCLRGRRALKPKKCPEKPHLDVLGHNPLSGFEPGATAFWHAGRPDDVYPPDMHELTRIIDAARAHRRIVPLRGTELWATELLEFSKPPYGTNQTAQANYLADALFVLWKQGVSRVTWVGMNDGYLASGLYDDNGNPKLAAQAFRFPFVARDVRKGRVRVWGMAPGGGSVQIERQAGAGWDTVATLKSKRRVFTDVLQVPGTATLRATAGDQHSLAR